METFSIGYIVLFGGAPGQMPREVNATGRDEIEEPHETISLVIAAASSYKYRRSEFSIFDCCVNSIYSKYIILHPIGCNADRIDFVRLKDYIESTTKNSSPSSQTFCIYYSMKYMMLMCTIAIDFLRRLLRIESNTAVEVLL